MKMYPGHLILNLQRLKHSCTKTRQAVLEYRYRILITSESLPIIYIDTP